MSTMNENDHGSREVNGRKKPRMRRNPILILTGSWLLSLLLLPVAGFIVWSMYESYIQVATREFRLQQLVGDVVYFNEMLTQAARMAATTGKTSWEDKYREVEPKLDNAIVDIAGLARTSYETSYTATTKRAYSKLIEMENLALALVRRGRLEEANAILFGDDYEAQKREYSRGIQAMAQAIQDSVQKNLTSLQRRMITVGVLGLLIILVLLGVWLGAVLIVRMQLAKRKRAEEALAQSESKFRNLVESAPLGIFLCDAEGKLIQTNPALGQIIPAGSVEELSESPDLPASPFFTRAGVNEAVSHCMRTGETIVSEVPYTAGNGDYRYVRIHLSPFVDDRGQIHGVQGLVEDFTERKNAEINLSRAHALASAEAQKLRSLIEGIEEGVVFAGPDDLVTEANTWFLQRMDLTRDQVMGKSLWAIGIDRHFGPEFALVIKDYQLGKRAEAQEFQLHWQDMHVSFRLYPMFSRGSYAGVILNVIDVTELARSRERAQQADRSKGQFLANMSHEIRTPMNAVIGMAELALNTSLTPAQREYLETIEMSAHSLLALINDILDFSKIEAGKLQLHPAPMDLRDHVCSTVQTLAPQAHSKGLELACRIAPAIPDKLIGDQDRIRQIIMNLMGNAVKFTSQGEIVLQMEMESRNEESVYLRMTVCDSGIGIPFEKQKVIFSAFEQADGSTSRHYGGTGLGLAITAQLVELMGGRIWVESIVGKGSTFYVTFPLSIQQELDGTTELAVQAELKGLRVLVVDDNATNRRILEELITQWEMVPVVVAGGQEALAELEHASNRNEPFAVAMIDCMMPVMDGFELAKCIRQSPGLSSLKILMLTSAGPDAGMESIQNLGIDACLLKPIHQSNLYNTLVRVMSNSGRQPFQAAEPTSARIPTTRRPLKILLAEDNAFNQKVAMGMLSHMGHAVTVVTNGHEAVNAFGGDRFDLILMDVQMPYMDGFEATRRIRAMEALNDGKRLPIIAMTAYAMKGDREKCLDAGMDGYLAKPVNSRELASVIENVSSHFNASECSDLRGLDGKAVVNLSGLLESVGGNRELLDEMLAIFSEDSPKLMSEIALAIGNQDPDGLRIAAHSLKSMVAGLGASSAVEAALRLENMGRSLDMAYAREALVILENELGIVHEALAGDGRDADI